MQDNKIVQKFILPAIIILVGAGFGYFIYSDFFAGSSFFGGKVATSTAEYNLSATSSADGGGELVVGEIKEVGESELAAENAAKIKAPDLDRPFAPKSSLPEDIRQNSISRVNFLTGQLKENKLLRDSWMELALYRKGAADYKGAEEIWVYVTKIWPLNYVAFANLGDLHVNYLKDYGKAEAYLLEAVSVEPTYIEGYRRLDNLYRFHYKVGSGADLSILERGLENNPNNPGILVPLAEYYKEKGNNAKALEYYRLALSEAEKAGDTGFADALKKEIENL